MADAIELELLVRFAKNYMAGRRAGFTETANDSRDAERLIERLANYKATPLPADAALIGKLRHQLAQATDEAARLRALSQPEVAQVPQSWIDAATKAKQPTPDVCKAYPGAASAHIAGLANLILRMAAPSAKGGAK